MFSYKKAKSKLADIVLFWGFVSGAKRSILHSKGKTNTFYTAWKLQLFHLKHVCALELLSLVLFDLHGTREINLNKKIKQKFSGSLSFIIGKLKIPITLLYMDLQKRRKVLTLFHLYSNFPELYFHWTLHNFAWQRKETQRSLHYFTQL